MADRVLARPNQFSQQAQLHHKIRDSLKEVVSSFDVHHDNIVSQLDSSYQEGYRKWWQNLRKYLLNHAELHDQMGNNLKTAGGNFDTVDEDIAKYMQGNGTPSNP